ncbi:molybdopterin-dependent oxidoreductase [Bacillus marasmi]|uniref:molybdopterin-dependent oxidoreductase n=1 Tax=Bacillus marasmi TaxID=1926279 RepID=UPI0011CAF681|nr:molybdopterin-dependent oxidoreductase [Bacillus marasmi]
MNDGIFRNTCPRNCYGTCAILSHVKDGKLIKVTGDAKHGYTKGKLCAKGYASTQFVYDSKRLRYPMIQKNRGSGIWTRISWDEAYTIIAKKMIELYDRYGSNLASGYNKFSGNIGLLHYATEGMFNSIGPHTKSVGNVCSLSGKLSINQSFGHNFSSVPEDMAHSKLIVIWGANPAVTNVHQMKFIYEARKKGAKFIVIDPLLTETAKKADIYIQIKPGSDAWLAHGVAKLLVESGNYTKDSLQTDALGWDEYQSFLVEQVTLSEVSEITGVPYEAITELAKLYKEIKPACTWNGLGIQRTFQGKESISAINSLVAISGNLSIQYGGIYYMHFDVDHFPLNLLNHRGPSHPTINSSREINLSNYPETALSLDSPPLKLLWVASRNMIVQDQNLKAWEQLMNQLELIVVVDLYMTKTAQQADIILPAASHFEEEDLNVGYWHYWLSINEKSISPFYEAKSDLQIARELTRKLNDTRKGFSNFPAEKEPLDWIEGELTSEIMEMYSIKSYKDLLKGPQKKKEIHILSTEQRKYKLFSPSNSQNNDGTSLINNEPDNMYRLLSPQSLLKIHSQFESLSWLNTGHTELIIEISIEAATTYNIENQQKIEVYNRYGAIVGVAKINPYLPKDIIVTNQGGKNPINRLVVHKSDSDSSTFFYDSMVKLRKWREGFV